MAFRETGMCAFILSIQVYYKRCPATVIRHTELASVPTGSSLTTVTGRYVNSTHTYTLFTRPTFLPVFSLRKQCQVLLNLGRGFLQISSHCSNPDRSALILLRSIVSKLSIPYIREGLLIFGSLGCHNLLKVTVFVWHRCVDNAVAVDPNLSFLCTHEGRWYDPDNSAGCVCKPGYTHTPDACVGKCWRFLISYPWWRFV